ncbi:MAG TPA: fimbria/pilus outer membrane usher protein [Sphingopyxis sp.]|nr:fimbria/pilus outer membrane usher protein [Sphingopyxis sp.]
MLVASPLLHPLPGIASTSGHAGYGELPPPPRGAFAQSEQALMLELFVNGRATGHVAPVLRQGHRFRVALADLRRAGLRIERADEVLFLDELADVEADYDASRQLLRLTVAPAYLPRQRFGAKTAAFEPADYDMGALLNYDVYVSGGSGTKAQASLYHEARLFGPVGTVSTTGTLRSGHRKAYVRFDTVWRRSDEATMTTIEVGDFITRGLPWAPAVRLGGIQVSRDFSVRPDIVTYPLPEFSGTAALPSSVDLLVGGRRIAGGPVNPGPFVIPSAPPVTGAGEANLVVTDMHGRSIAATLPFYVSSDLLRPGLTDFALAFGAFREHYGLRNFAYGGVAASASLRHGATPGITLEVRAEIADDMQLAGGGAIVKLGNGGVVSGAYSRSFGPAGAGGELTLGYEYRSRLLALALRHSRRDSAYADLGSVECPRCLGARSINSATLSLALGHAGTLGFGYFGIDSDGGADSRLANASWTLPLGRGSRFHASATRAFDEKSWSGALGFSIPLGGRGGHLGVGYADNGSGASWRADYARATPSGGGLGWNASAVRAGGDNYLRGDISLRTDPLLLRAGAYGSDGVTGWAGASGSLVIMDGSLFAANRIADSFVVINTGEGGIPVRYENRLVGRTNEKGQLLIPWASAFYPAQYEIDPLSLPANVRVPVVSQRIAVARGSGHVVHFPVERLRAAQAVLRNETGSPLPVGARVQATGGASTHVGWDGVLFLEDVAADNHLVVELPGGARCEVRFGVPAGNADDIIDLGELPCIPLAD